MPSRVQLSRPPATLRTSSISAPLLLCLLALSHCATFEALQEQDAQTDPAGRADVPDNDDTAELDVPDEADSAPDTPTPVDATDDGSGDAADGTDAADAVEVDDASGDGSGAAPTPCPTGTECEGIEVCVDGVCVSQICVPDAASCIDARTAGVCDGTGTVLTAEDCTSGAGCTPLSCGCAEGRCLKLEPCEPGETRCLGAVVQRCVASGEGFADEAVCDAALGFVCTNGACGCPGDRLDCEGVCADPLTDRLHCGGCGEPCAAGESCVGGDCACAPGSVDCEGVCTTTATDPANCGTCGRACSLGSTCVDGDCVCPSGYTECGEDCFDLTRDQDNCGACGRGCALDQACSGSTCRCISAGFTVCGGACVNTSTDNNHCGFCGSVCPSGQRCSGGLCECTGGRLNCGGTCVDAQRDRLNCGECGTRCSLTQLCREGACVESTCNCPTGTLLCDSGLFCSTPETGCCAPLGVPLYCGLESCVTE